VAGFKPPFKVELAFTVENPGSRLVTFTGQCPWEDPSRSLTRRWQGGVVLEPMDKARALKGIRYLIRDRDGRKVAALTGPDARIHPESLKGIVLRLTVGNLGEPGGAIEHRLALEF
jgi:hypothetical protein